MLLFGSMKPHLKAQIQGDFGVHTAFNGRDINWGLQAGIAFQDLDLSLRGDFSNRMGPKRVLVESANNPNLLYQYREARYYLGLETEKRFTIMEFGNDHRFGACAALWGGYSFGDYKGTSVAPDHGFSIRGRVAPFVQFDEQFTIKAGYEYLPLRVEDISDHRFFIGFTANIGNP